MMGEMVKLLNYQTNGFGLDSQTNGLQQNKFIGMLIT